VNAIPTRATYLPGEPVALEFDPPITAASEVIVTRLAEELARLPLGPGATYADLGTFDVGGYGVRIGSERTAFDVLESRWDRPRYGFVVALDTDVDAEQVARFYRRLHLNAAQLYDWAYRHSQLMPPTREYIDPLGQPRDLDAVNRMSTTLASAGVVPLGYAAVYAVGHDEVEQWRSSLLLRSSGEPYRLGDNFLVLVDPAEPTWLAHLTDQLAEVVAGTAIQGFHLDQYGWPKFATRGDGERVDLADSFSTMIRAVRDRLPSTPFMFNNVNDFPTHATAGLPQDATYIEVWEPHSTLGDLGSLANAAWAARRDHPPILSAYLSSYAAGDDDGATEAAKLVMATAFSHGAAHLLLGEAGSALVDPYYPNNHALRPADVAIFAAWYDFAVRYGDLLYGPSRADVTEFFTGGINEDVVVVAPGVEVSTKADAGTLWLRIVRTSEGVVVHVINLASQGDNSWDSPRAATHHIDGATLALAFVDSGATVFAASPESPDMTPLVEVGATSADQVNALSAGQSGVRFGLPALGAWTVVWIPSVAIGF